jgi:PAS domain S-box-containing protein
MRGSSGAAITVLYVDGSDRRRAECRRRLGAADESLTVETAASVSDAVTAFESGVDHCVVSRYHLPDGDGLDLLADVRDVDGDVPFVLYTERGDETVASEAIAAGVDDYVTAGDTDWTGLAERVVSAVETARTRQQLAESEQRYRTLVEGSHDGIYIYRDDRFQFVNDRVSEITGYDRDALYEMSIWDIVHPEDRDRVRDIGARRRRGEDAPNTYDARIVTADGETRYLEFSVQSTSYRGEWAALGSVRDVTERRRRERQFREEHEFVETLLDTLDDVIFVSTLDGDILRWNDRMVEVTGYPPARLEEMNVFELLRGDYDGVSADVVRDRVESRDGGLQVEVETADGETIPFEFRGSTLTNEDGEIDAIAGVARDVTERRRREQELAQYQTIIEAVGDPVYTLDEEGRITLVNEALEEITGYSEAELLGEHVSILMRDEDVATAQRLIERLLKSDEQRNGTFEMEAVTKDGRHIPCEDHVAVLRGPDGFEGTAGVVRDISDRKERERTLRQQNERLDQFAGVVSHDLRNPLNVIVGRLDHARETGDDVHFDAIERAARRMERMIDDLLTLARDGQRVGEVEPVSLDAIVDRAWGTVETGDADLVVEGSLGTVAADEDRLPSLFENLFRNAVEHGSTGNRNAERSDDAVEHGSTSPDSQARQDAVDHGGAGVTVRVGTIETDSTTGFFVADDGPGISEDQHERVFDHGYTTADEGTGLGLVIVEGITQAHGWEIATTESREGGARFEVTGVSRPD